MKKLDKKNKIRLAALLIFLVVMAAATLLMIPFIQLLTTEEGRLQIERQVEALGPWGWLAFLLLEIVQVVVAMIPGEPVQILAGVLFGTWGGVALCLVGMLIGTVIIFYAVRAVGPALVHAFVSEEQMGKFKFLRFMEDQKKLETVVFIFFLIPGVPKDVLTYLIPLTPIQPLKFFMLATLARIPALAASTLIGDNIGAGKWTETILIFVVAAVIGLGGIFLKDKISKKIKERHGAHMDQ